MLSSSEQSKNIVIPTDME